METDNMNSNKTVPMTRKEVLMLLRLIEANPIIVNKATNAINNQLKELAWTSITEHFNAAATSCQRKPEQIKLKWENLKKSARKRKKEESEPTAPDKVLDKVDSIMDQSYNSNMQLNGNASMCSNSSSMSSDDLPHDIFAPTVETETIEPKTTDVKESIAAKNRAIAEYYEAKKRNEHELFLMKKRLLEFDILERKNKMMVDMGDND